ncbi:MAG: DUF3710 domain-containing protein [Marmoricola sp.]
MRLRRKNGPQDVPADAGTSHEGVATDDGGTTGSTPGSSQGPIDAADIDPAATYIDLGSMLLPPPDLLDLRLQVDEESGEVLAVLLVADEGVVEMRAYASSRGGDLWADARREIAADTTRRGGTATEQDGPFGPELYCEVPVTGPEGEAFVQPSRVVGCTGPRWFVRATLAGRPAQDPEYARQFEDALRAVAVRRGSEAMAPGEPLPLRLPPEARQQTEEEAAAELAAAEEAAAATGAAAPAEVEPDVGTGEE